MADFKPFQIKVGGTKIEIANATNLHDFFDSMITQWKLTEIPIEQEEDEPSKRFTIYKYFINELLTLRDSTDSKKTGESNSLLSALQLDESIADILRTNPEQIVRDFNSMRPIHLFKVRSDEITISDFEMMLSDTRILTETKPLVTPGMHQRLINWSIETIASPAEIGLLNANIFALGVHYKEVEEDLNLLKEQQPGIAKRISDAEKKIEEIQRFSGLLTEFKNVVKTWKDIESSHRRNMNAAYIAAGVLSLMVVIYCLILAFCYNPINHANDLLDLRKFILTTIPIGIGVSVIMTAVKYAGTSRMAVIDAKQRSGYFSSFIDLTRDPENGLASFRPDDAIKAPILEALLRRPDLANNNGKDTVSPMALDAIIKAIQNK